MINMDQTRPSPSGPAAWTVAIPIPQIDRFLLSIRWAALLGVSVVIVGTEASSVYHEFYGAALVSPLAALPIVICYNLALSILIWQKQPLVKGQVGWLLLADVFQATLFTALTGGLGSFFFILFPIAIIETTLVVRWQTALALTAGICLLYILVVIFNLTSGWNTLVVSMLTARSFVVLMLGYFGDLLQPADAPRGCRSSGDDSGRCSRRGAERNIFATGRRGSKNGSKFWLPSSTVRGCWRRSTLAWFCCLTRGKPAANGGSRPLPLPVTPWVGG